LLDSHFLLASARVVDFPIVYCNDGFCEMSGWSRVDIMQRPASCTFMQGELTNPETVKRLTDAFDQNQPEQVEVLLYKRLRKHF